jgi:hypothetical protein
MMAASMPSNLAREPDEFWNTAADAAAAVLRNRRSSEAPKHREVLAQTDTDAAGPAADEGR